MANPVIVEKLINAPASTVWQALTDEAQMRKWYFDVSAFKPLVGFEFTFEGRNGDMVYHHLCRVTEVVPLQRLAYSWRYQGYPGDSLVTIRALRREGGATRVKLTHTGLGGPSPIRRIATLPGRTSKGDGMRLLGRICRSSWNSAVAGIYDVEGIE